MKYDYLIVGSGLFGSIFAYEATKRNKKCLVIDKRPHVRDPACKVHRRGIGRDVCREYQGDRGSREVQDIHRPGAQGVPLRSREGREAPPPPRRAPGGEQGSGDHVGHEGRVPSPCRDGLHKEQRG